MLYTIQEEIMVTPSNYSRHLHNTFRIYSSTGHMKKCRTTTLL